MKYILALDQGTTSSRSILFDETMNVVSVAQREFRQIYPQPGWVEHDPFDILSTQMETMREAVAKAGIYAKDILAVGITNQRETTLVWDKHTGRPICNAIVWQCRRSAEICSQLRAYRLEDLIKSRTGLVTDAYFSASKVKWILDNIHGARANAEAGDLIFGTVDSWLIWNLTKEKHHLTDVTNASRTMLFNIYTMKWDQEILRTLGIPFSMLPSVQPCAADYGHIRGDVLGVEIPICGVAGDQQSALFGQACFKEGDAKNTYGTGCFLLMNTGKKPVASKNLLTTVAWDIGQGPVYALEGSVFTGGAVVQWLRDGLELIRSSSETEGIALSVTDSGGVFFVPAFNGLGAPWWDMYARGTIVGITRGTTKANIVRAALEAIAYQSADLLNSMEDDSGINLTTLKVDGGASANNFLMQFQADIIGRTVDRPTCVETTARGAALFAGLRQGVFSGMEEVAGVWRADRKFTPSENSQKVRETFSDWHRAINRAAKWIE